MFKKFIVALMFVGTIGFSMSGCAGIHAVLNDPAKAQVAQVTLLEAAGAVFDNNPELKPQVVQVAKTAEDLLKGNTVITKAGAVSWLNGQLDSHGMNAHAKRLVDTLILLYMPDWSSSNLNFLQQADKDMLISVCDILITAASN